MKFIATDVTDSPAKMAEKVAAQLGKPGFAIDSYFYRSHVTYQTELEQILYKSWLYAGHISEVQKPGDYFLFQVGDESVIVVRGRDGEPLPGLAPVAMQQGRYLSRRIRAELRGEVCPTFAYRDRGKMATIGRSRAICQTPHFQFAGRLAWFAWLLVHIYYLVGFKNRLFVVLQWAWAHLTFRRGARLIVSKEWRFYPPGRP